MVPALSSIIIGIRLLENGIVKRVLYGLPKNFVLWLQKIVYFNSSKSFKKAFALNNSLLFLLTNARESRTIDCTCIDFLIF